MFSQEQRPAEWRLRHSVRFMKQKEYSYLMGAGALHAVRRKGVE